MPPDDPFADDLDLYSAAEVVAAMCMGSMALEFARQPEMLATFTAWLRKTGSRGMPVPDQDPAVLERLDEVLTELAFQAGVAAGMAVPDFPPPSPN